MEEREIYEYYESLLRTALWQKEYPMHTRYRLARDYDGVNFNAHLLPLTG